MSIDIEKFCKSCRQCGERNKPVPAPRASLGQLPASAPMEVVALDILSGLPVTSQGHRHLLVVIDHFSRFVECIPLKTEEATEVAQAFVREFVSRYGVPKTIHSDLGDCFTGEVMKLTCQLLGMEQSHTTAFHPMGNSICERINRTVLGMLSKFLDAHEHSDWDIHLPLLMLGLRSQVHRSLGVSPYCVLFGREPRLPADVEYAGPTRCRTRPITEYLERLHTNLSALHKVALENSNKSHQKNKMIYERKVNEFSYLPGDKVYLHKGVVPRGQYYKFLRPWKRAVMVEQVGSLNYRIRLEGAKATLIVHHNRLKLRVDTGEGVVPAIGPTASAPPADPAAGSQQAVGAAAGRIFPTGRRRIGGDIDSQTVSGTQCNGRSSQPADAAVPDDSRAPVLSLLNPFALSFAPQIPSVQSETGGIRHETGETMASAAEPIAGSAPTGATRVLPDLANPQVTAEMRSPELRRSTRVPRPPNKFSPYITATCSAEQFMLLSFLLFKNTERKAMAMGKT